MINYITYFKNLVSETTVLSVFFKLLLSLICGGMIGIDRGMKRRAAGFRTYMLVCLGATLVMITNQYIANLYGSDPARLGAQVISGIGFLGAGTIIVTRSNQVIGLTTAAGLWASACMGLAIGVGFYEGALIATFFIFIIITVFNGIDRKFTTNSKSMEIYAELVPEGKMGDLLTFMHKNSIRVSHVEFLKATHSDVKSVAAVLSLRLPKKHPHFEIVEMLQSLECVSFVDEI